MNDDQQILARLERLGELLFARDPGIVDELWSDGFRLIGSEKGEIAETRDQLDDLFARLFHLDARLCWAWDTKTITIENDIAWVFAKGHVEIAHPDRIDRRPYRLVAIFRKVDGNWRWRLFSGSEPA